MKKIALILLIISGGILGFYLGKINKKNSKNVQVQKTKINSGKTQKEKTPLKSRSIFIPYWSLTDDSLDLSVYDRAIYFGIIPDYGGIDKNEAGYLGIPEFIKITGGKKKYITLRMIDSDLNNYILENKILQEKIIRETLEIVEQYSVDGVVLDLEISININKDLTSQINNFVQTFYSATIKNYRQFSVAIYGDSFFKGRPFDLNHIGKNSDEILIMAYDLHKSRGEPGPNFPYESGSLYRYNFKKMITDFTEVVPKEKISVIFGMFGYDWLVDEKKRPIRQAEALSLNEIKKKFLEKCEFENCVNKRDLLSKESEVNYIISAPAPDEQQIYRIDYHIVWFEDEESVKVKTDYLREQGIGNISYWAYGYF